MTTYEKENQTKEIPDFNWIVAIFGWLGPLSTNSRMCQLLKCQSIFSQKHVTT